MEIPRAALFHGAGGSMTPHQRGSVLLWIAIAVLVIMCSAWPIAANPGGIASSAIPAKRRSTAARAVARALESSAGGYRRRTAMKGVLGGNSTNVYSPVKKCTN